MIVFVINYEVKTTKSTLGSRKSSLNARAQNAASLFRPYTRNLSLLVLQRARYSYAMFTFHRIVSHYSPKLQLA